MITRTFCHIPGIGMETERALWEQGCLSWDDFLSEPGRFSIGTASHKIAIDRLCKSRDALARRDHQFFREQLGTSEAWRAWPLFSDSCVYLDIETDGRTSGDAVTLIGLYDGNSFECLVKGDNLGNFRDIISRYSMVVTFYGAVFDLPMLERCFKGFKFDQIHMDLCFTLKKLGYRGGLKKIEKLCGICRGDDTEGMNGLDAVRLWRAHQKGCTSSLNKLIAYNREDVVNLETLAQIAYDGLSRQLMRKDRPAPIG